QKVEHLDSGWRFKFSNFCCHAGIYGFFSGVVNVMKTQFIPRFIGHFDMLAKYTFSSLIVQNQTLGDMFEFAAGRKLSSIGAAVDHEGSASAGLAAFCTQ